MICIYLYISIIYIYISSFRSNDPIYDALTWALPLADAPGPALPPQTARGPGGGMLLALELPVLMGPITYVYIVYIIMYIYI